MGSTLGPIEGCAGSPSPAQPNSELRVLEKRHDQAHRVHQPSARGQGDRRGGRDSLDERSAGAATIHCSSHTDFRRPTAGDSLAVSLKRALGASDVVVFIFTSEAEDWSWCMWECGVATDPNDERSTKVVVLQCGDSAPRPIGEHVRVDVRIGLLTGFVKTILRPPTTSQRWGRP